jgi:hypothetical protein
MVVQAVVGESLSDDCYPDDGLWRLPVRRRGRGSFDTTAFDYTLSGDVADFWLLVVDPACAPTTDPRCASRDRIRVRGFGTAARLPNNRWPSWFDPTPIELEPEPDRPFPQSLRLMAPATSLSSRFQAQPRTPLASSSKTVITASFSPGIAPTPKTCCCEARSTASAPTRRLNASHTSESATTSPRGRPSTSSPTTPAPAFDFSDAQRHRPSRNGDGEFGARSVAYGPAINRCQPDTRGERTLGVRAPSRWRSALR